MKGAVEHASKLSFRGASDLSAANWCPALREAHADSGSHSGYNKNTAGFSRTSVALRMVEGVAAARRTQLTLWPFVLREPRRLAPGNPRSRLA